MARHDRRELLAVFAGGAVGTLARAGLALTVPADSFPWATFGANLLAALVLGVVTVRLAGDRYRRPLIGTGFCGGLSTFSTFQVETVRLVEHGHTPLAVAYLAASLLLGYAALRLGELLG